MIAEVIAVEPEVKHAAFGYIGHPDAIVRLKGSGEKAIPDWKTPQTESLSWPVQSRPTALLRRSPWVCRATEAGWEDSPGEALRLKPQHSQVFLSALNCHRYFNQKKG